VNYDSGNSASLGYSPSAEFGAYGSRVGSVHIKDRVRGGGTVPLGTGDTDFDTLFSCLDDAAYEGDYVLQVARGADGDEVNWARRNRAFLASMQAVRA
jgi:hexulose-6-phosphate isomerase